MLLQDRAPLADGLKKQMQAESGPIPTETLQVLRRWQVQPKTKASCGVCPFRPGVQRSNAAPPLLFSENLEMTHGGGHLSSFHIVTHTQ